MIDTPPSKSSVRKAGSVIRSFEKGEISKEDLDAAVEVLVAFRAQFTAPLVKVNNALRSFCSSLQIESEVTQRLKKSATIQNKLSREAGLDLSRMQDIGGCRVVVRSVHDLRCLEYRIRRTWGTALHHEKDYIAHPRDSGYRAVHLIVLRDGHQIEIQLRTELMHNWAETVEAFSAMTRTNLKQDGDDAVQRFMKALSEHAACSEEDETVPDGLLDRIAILRQEVLGYLESLRMKREGNV